MRKWITRLFRRSIESENAIRIKNLRRQGVRIGEGCYIFSDRFSTEPYLIQLGDRVAVAAGVRFITHNALAFRLRASHPNFQSFGPITIGDDTIIGTDAIILPNTVIGKGCFVNAGAVVYGVVPDDTMMAGNPARFSGKVSDMLTRLPDAPGRLDVFHLPEPQRRERIERHFGLRS